MKIYKIYPKGFASNSYILKNDGLNAVLIDCAQPEVLDECVKLGLVPQYVLLTHGHFDHVGGCAKSYNVGAQIYCGEKEEEVLFHRLNYDNGVDMDFKVEKTLKDGEKINLCGMDFTVIATPGHSKGSVCYRVDDKIFVGDTLFFESVGRWDLPTGNGNQLLISIKKLYAIPGNFTLYCGWVNFL